MRPIGMMRPYQMLLLLVLTYWKLRTSTTEFASDDWEYRYTFPSLASRRFLLHRNINLELTRKTLSGATPAEGLTTPNGVDESISSFLQTHPTATPYRDVSNSRRGTEMMTKSMKILALRNTTTIRDAASVSAMLMALIEKEFRECDLVLAYDSGYFHQVQDLLLLPNARQMMHINTAEVFLRIIWKSSACRAYLFLLDNPEPLLNFASYYHHDWDYHGRFVLVLPSLQHLEAFTNSRNGKKTEHVVGAVKSNAEGEWLLYINQLYLGHGMRPISTWRRQGFTQKVDFFPDKVSDLQGASLKVTTFMFEPSVMYHWAPNGSLLFRYGLDIDVINALAKVLNFTIDFMEPPNGETWGEKYDNGSWFGLTGQLQREEADIGIADVFVSLFRVDAVDFSAPYTSEMTCFLARTEPPLPRWQALAFPFHLWTWLVILIGLIASGPLLFLMAWCSGRIGDEMRSLQTLSFSCYYAFGMHFCEAHAHFPRMTSTRIFVLFLWLYTMIVTIAYSTNLRAFLIVRKPPAMMESIRDLYDSNVQVAAVGNILKAGIASSSDPYLQGLINVYKGYDTREETYPLVLQGKAVFLGSRLMLEFLVQNKFTHQGVPRLRIMKEYYAPYSIAMALQRHSPLKRKVDQVIGWIRQSGLVRHYFLKSLRQATVYEDKSDDGRDSGVGQEEVMADGVIPLSMDHMQGIFLITSISWVFSFLVILLEKSISSDKS